MGVTTSLYVIEITINGYDKNHLLITKKQLKNDIGNIVINYISNSHPYKSKSNFINYFYSQLSEPIYIDKIILPKDGITYKEKEKYIIKYLHKNILLYIEKGESIDLNSFVRISAFCVNDFTSFKL